MTKSTKWALFTFAVLATFTLGMLFARTGQPFGTAFSNARGDLNPQNQESGKTLLLSPGSGNAGTSTAAKTRLLDLGPDKSNTTGVFKPQAQAGNNLLLNPGGGNVGIGTFNPNQLLTVSSARSKVGVFTISDVSNSTLQLRRARAGPAVVAIDNVLGAVNGFGFDGTNYEKAAGILFRVDGTAGLDDMPGRIEFRTAPDGTNIWAERMRIDNAGNIGIGTTTPNEQLEITGNFRLPTTTTTVGVIKSDGNRFIHSFGTTNFFAGVNAGNLTMTGTGNNTGVGVNALFSNTTGSRNTATGKDALLFNTTGNNNTATGQNALETNTTGSRNTATGKDALRFNTTGNNNTATGENALEANTTGNSNTATGRNALLLNTEGVENTATGARVLSANTTGSFNTATGFFALDNNTTGFRNTAFGKDALVNNTTGNFNTAIGFFATVTEGNLTNATAIGANAIVDASNKIQLGDQNVTVIEGPVSFTSVSDANLKENFLAIDGEETLEALAQMSVGSWNYKGHDPLQFRHYGPTAQDFFAAFGDDGFGVVGTDTTINSGDMAGIMMIAIQALEKRTAQVAKLEQLVGEQQARMRRMEERLKALEAMSPAKYNEN